MIKVIKQSRAYKEGFFAGLAQARTDLFKQREQIKADIAAEKKSSQESLAEMNRQAYKLVGATHLARALYEILQSAGVDQRR